MPSTVSFHELLDRYEFSSDALDLLESASVITFCYVIGTWNWSVLWVAFLSGASFLQLRLLKGRAKRRMTLQAAAKFERDFVMKTLKDDQAYVSGDWVTFPNTEKVEWLNRLVLKLWPNIAEYAKFFIKEQIELQIRSNLPSAFKSFKFQEIDLGDIPFRVSSVTVYDDSEVKDRIIADLDIAYNGDSNFVVGVGGFKAGINYIQFSGRMRCVFHQLLPRPPLAGAVTATFMEAPEFDFNLTGIGEMVELPGLFSAIKGVVSDQMSNIIVAPHRIIVPMDDKCNLAELYLPDPDGVVQITRLEGRDLEAKDIAVFGKATSDPYVILSVGCQNLQTCVIDKELNPVWPEQFEAVVDTASGQRVTADLYDSDAGSADDFLGRCSLNLQKVRDQGTYDQWIPLQSAKHGELRLRMQWIDLSTDRDDFDANYITDQHLTLKTTAICMVHIDKVENLPTLSNGHPPTTYVRLLLNPASHSTAPQFKSCNPVFSEKKVFFVQSVRNDTLQFEIMNEGTDTVLGEYVLTLRRLLDSPGCEMMSQQVTVGLRDGNECYLQMSVKLLAYKRPVGRVTKL